MYVWYDIVVCAYVCYVMFVCMFFMLCLYVRLACVYVTHVCCKGMYVFVYFMK